MKRKAAMWIVLSALLCMGNPARGQQPPPSYDHLKPLEWLAGDWVGEYTATVDLGEVKKGDRVTSYASQRWILSKSFLAQDFSMELGGKRVPDTHEVIGWDAAEKKLVHWIYSPLGTGSGVWTEVGEKAIVRWSADIAEGKLAGTSVLQKVDDDTYTWQATGVTLGDKKLPDWPKVTYRRKCGAGPGDLWEAYRKAAVGTWNGEGTLNRDFPGLGITAGDRFKMRLSLKPEMDGKALVGESTLEMVAKPFRASNRVLAGWDPDLRQVRFVAFWNGELVEEIVLTQMRGTAFVGSYSAKFPGSPTQRARIRMDYPDADSYVITFLDGPHKGEELSSWKRQAAPDHGTGPSSTAPALLKEYAASMVGQWECESAVPWIPVPGASTVPASATCSWTLDGAALQWDLQIGEASTRALVGVDPESQRLKEFVVTSTGDCFLVFISKEGDKWVTTAELTMPDGKRKAIRAVTTFDKDGNRHVNEYPTHKDVFTRVKTK